MKPRFISIALVFALLSAGAFAVTKFVSYKEFKRVALDAAQSTENEECQLRVKENDGGLVLSMQNGDKTVSFFTSRDSKIKRVGNSSSDGSYSYKYVIAGQGTLTVDHMDDASFYVTLKSLRNSKTAHCDIDY